MPFSQELNDRFHFEREAIGSSQGLRLNDEFYHLLRNPCNGRPYLEQRKTAWEISIAVYNQWIFEIGICTKEEGEAFLIVQAIKFASVQFRTVFNHYRPKSSLDFLDDEDLKIVLCMLFRKHIGHLPCDPTTHSVLPEIYDDSDSDEQEN